jgi:hypothetical protein
VLKRIVVDLCIVLVVVALVVGLVVGYSWFKDRPERAKLRKEAEEFLREQEAINQGLESLGDIDLQPDKLTFAALEERFHQPSLRLARGNHTKTGWACGKERCALWFYFLIPAGQEVPPNAKPDAIWVIQSSPHHEVAIGGVRIGEPVDEMKKYCRTRGFGNEAGFNRIMWDKEWILIWADMKSKVTMLLFMNEKQLKNSPSHIAPRTNATKPTAFHSP